VDDPWLRAVVPEDPDAPLPDAPFSVYACSDAQVAEAEAEGLTEVVARQSAMAATVVPGAAPDDVDAGVPMGEVGALNDRAYGYAEPLLEQALARLPADRVRAYGRRAPGGALVSCALAFDVGGDTSVQYVATDPAARHAGHATVVMRALLAGAAARGQRTSTLVASSEGRPLYERLGYAVVGTVELRRRPAA
jgi:GNAT superfamily N-acetyltransferase